MQEDKLEDKQQPVDKSQQPVDKSQQPVDKSQQPVDKSQQSVDKSQQPVDKSEDEFNAEDYLKSLEPEDDDQPNIEALQNENALLKKQNEALKGAYLDLKKTGVTVVSNPQSNNNQVPTGDQTTKEADAMLAKWLHG